MADIPPESPPPGTTDNDLPIEISLTDNEHSTGAAPDSGDSVPTSPEAGNDGLAQGLEALSRTGSVTMASADVPDADAGDEDDEMSRGLEALSRTGSVTLGSTSPVPPKSDLAPAAARTSSSGAPKRPPPPADRTAADGITHPSVSIRAGTFNINGKPPRTEDGRLVDLSEWVGPDEDADICVYGFQELDDDTQTLMLNLASAKVADWVGAIDAWLPGGKYKKLATHQMVGIVIVVYIKVSLGNRVTNVLCSSVATGMMGFGNKGGVAIRFDLDRTGFCFINSHFAAHQGAVDKRNSDFRDILQGLKFWEDAPDKTDSVHVLQHERVVWMGDLNYRVDCEREKILSLIETQAYAGLLEMDQLVLQRREGKTFKGFDEAAISFAPTYKFDPGTDTYDTSPKARLPAWCDRVLFLSVDGFGVAAVEYTSHPSIKFSDHKPVTATLKIALCGDEDSMRRRPSKLQPIYRDPRPTSVGDAARGAVQSARAMGGSLLESFKSMGSFG